MEAVSKKEANRLKKKAARKLRRAAAAVGRKPAQKQTKALPVAVPAHLLEAAAAAAAVTATGSRSGADDDSGARRAPLHSRDLPGAPLLIPAGGSDQSPGRRPVRSPP